LQEREYQRLGSARTQKADIRVLAATNRDLQAAVAQGAFRDDLYYRLAVFDIALPPLRQRRDDIPALLDAFVEDLGRSIGRRPAGITRDARDMLVAHHWPGNVRELRNVVERAAILCEGGAIETGHLPAAIVAPRTTAAAGVPKLRGIATLDAAERAMIVEALERAGHNKSKAARFLGLTRAQLRARIDKYELT